MMDKQRIAEKIYPRMKEYGDREYVGKLISELLSIRHSDKNFHSVVIRLATLYANDEEYSHQ